jgi:hypothetical protein
MMSLHHLGLVCSTQIHPNPYGLGGIEVKLKLNSTSIPSKPRGLEWIYVQPNKALWGFGWARLVIIFVFFSFYRLI